MILGVTEDVDDHTRRAWRERRVAERELSVELDHTLDSAFERKRRVTTAHGYLNPVERYAQVFLPHQHIRPVTAAEDDSVMVLLPEETRDITAEGGDRSEESEWYVDNRTGVLYVKASQFRAGPIRGSGMIQNPRVRVSYRYGRVSEDADSDGVPDALPRAVRTATAKLVAADLIDTDQYGSMLGSGPENTPDQSQAAQRLRDTAFDALDRYRDSKVML
jgi:hypothetical protein